MYFKLHWSSHCSRNIHSTLSLFPFLPDNKISDFTKKDALGDDTLHKAQMISSVFDRVENIAGEKSKNACNIFLYSSHVF